jgi:hypothetical protein
MQTVGRDVETETSQLRDVETEMLMLQMLRQEWREMEMVDAILRDHISYR